MKKKVHLCTDAAIHNSFLGENFVLNTECFLPFDWVAKNRAEALFVIVPHLVQPYHVLVVFTSMGGGEDPSCTNATHRCTIPSVFLDGEENVTGNTRFLIVGGLDSDLDYIFVMAAVVTAEESTTIQGPLSEEFEFSFTSEGKSGSFADVLDSHWWQIVLPRSQRNFFSMSLSLSLSFVGRDRPDHPHHCVQCGGRNFDIHRGHYHHAHVPADTQVSLHGGRLTSQLAQPQSPLPSAVVALFLLSFASLSLIPLSLFVDFIFRLPAVLVASMPWAARFPSQLP